MLKEWNTFNYNYEFPAIIDSYTFFNTIKDVATLLFSFYKDIPNNFYFYKDENYQIKFSEDVDLLVVFQERLPYLYLSFMKSLNNDSNLFQYMINRLFIEKIIFFERKIVNKKIISTSNFYNISNLIFNDKKLLKTIFNNNFYYDDNTIYSSIKNKINKFYNIIQEKPNSEKIQAVSNIIQSLNGREGKYYFEKRFSFSWAVYIIINGNSLWLNELEKIISKETYYNDINFLVLGILLDDVNILSFYNEEKNTIIIDPNHEIKKINYYYFNHQIVDEKNISLLSLSIVLNSISVFKYLVDKADIDYPSGNYKETAIFFACKNNNLNFIEQLIDKKCDLTFENSNGNIASELLPLSEDADIIFRYIEDKRKAS